MATGKIIRASQENKVNTFISMLAWEVTMYNVLAELTIPESADSLRDAQQPDLTSKNYSEPSSQPGPSLMSLQEVWAFGISGPRNCLTIIR